MNTGGPAFPTRNTLNDGITMRDYFAAKVMQGLIGCPYWREDAGEAVGMHASNYTAKAAYLMADAMLKAREE